MKKKLLAFLFVAVMAVTVFAIAASASTGTAIPDSECYYTYDEDTGVFTISGTGPLPDAFRGYSRYASAIIFEDGVTSVPSEFCYNNQNLTRVEFGADVTTIGDKAFRDCSNLTEVVFAGDSKLQSIGYASFYASGIKNIECSDTLTSIGEYAFRNCQKLISADMGNGVQSIGRDAFAYCTSLTEITILGSYTVIPNELFWCCYELSNVNLNEGYTKISDNAFTSTKKLTGVSLPTTLTTIDSSAFKASALLSIIVPNSVTTIGKEAFYNCASLANVELSSQLNSIGSFAFALTAVSDIEIPGTVESLGVRVFTYCPSLKNVVLCEGVRVIEASCFANSSIQSIVFPTTLTTIGHSAFYSCKSLDSIDAKGSNMVLENKCFYECTALENVTLSDSTTSIGEFAFYNCTSLASINIPSQLTSIGAEAFRKTSSLNIEVDLPGTLTEVPSKLFQQSGITGLTLGEGITKINAHAFSYCYGLSSVVIPTTCTTLYDSAFYYTGLTDAYIPSSVTTIEGKNVFYSTGLPEGVRLTIHTQADAESVITWVNTYNRGILDTTYDPNAGEHECVFGAWVETTAPTVDAAGLLTKICECEATETHELPALNKTDYTYTETPATCAAVGTGYYAITVDGQTFTYTVELPKLDHVFGDWVVTTPATPLDDGVKTKECECGETATEAVPYEGQAAALDVVVDGTTVTATLKIVGAPDLTSIGFSIAYADKLNLTAAESLLEGNTTDSNTANNPVKFVWINGLANEDVNGDVLVLTFEIAEDVAVSAEDFTITYDADDVCVLGEDKTLVNVELETFVKVS